MDETQAQLIAEQLRHANSLVKAEMEALRAELGHYRELTNLRLNELESARLDHENRLRTATDGVTQFKLWAGLANGGAGLISIVAMLKAFLGGG